MNFLRFGLIGIIACSTIWAAQATYRKTGVRDVRYPQGISLREESIQAAHAGVFPGGRLRTHRGGGLHGGK